MNVLLISLGSAGDVLPFLPLGRRLKERGHAVTLLSHCYYEGKTRLSGLDFVPLDTSSEYERFVEDQPLLNTPWGISEFLRRHVLPKVSLQYELITQQFSRRNTVLVTRDLFDTAARLISEKLSIPVLWVFTTPSQLTTWKLRVELFAHGLAQDINLLRTALGLSPVSDWYSWLRYPKRSIALWPDWFAPPECDWPSDVASVGFVVEDGSETGEIPLEIKAILADGEPPILITAGTGVYLGAEFYTASAEACRLLNRRGILVTQYQKQLPKQLPDSVHWFSYLPFRTLMPHMQAVIHHGGMGTLSCALAAGIPQLVLAMGADRPDNAARLRHLGVAEYVLPPAWQPRMVAERLHRLTSSRAIRERCEDLARRVEEGTEPLTAACKVIEDVIPTPE